MPKARLYDAAAPTMPQLRRLGIAMGVAVVLGTSIGAGILPAPATS